jgi:hypothetical protein
MRAFAIVLLAAGCRASFPLEVKTDALMLSCAPATAREGEKMARINKMIQQCADRLNTLKDRAIFVQKTSDGITIVGGVIGIGAGLAAAVFSAANSSGTGHNDNRDASITAAVFSAAGGLIALVGKLVDAPSIPLDQRSRAERHWDIARKLIEEDGARLIFDRNEVDYRIVVARLAECMSDSPSADVPSAEQINARLNATSATDTGNGDGGVLDR